MNTHMYVLYVNWKYIYVKSEFLSQLSFIHLFISQYYWLPASCQALFQVLQLQGIKRSLHSTGVYIVWWGETDSNRAKIKDLVYQLLRNAMKENNAGIGERVPKDGGGDVCPDKRHYQRKLHWQGDILADTWNILIEKPRGSLGGSAWWVKETASAKALWQDYVWFLLDTGRKCFSELYNLAEGWHWGGKTPCAQIKGETFLWFIASYWDGNTLAGAEFTCDRTVEWWVGKTSAACTLL